jgi:competence protein ComEC
MLFIMDFIEKNRNSIIAVLLVLNAFIFWQVFAVSPNNDLRLYFLNVGQGDSQLVILPGGVKVIIDGGPANGAVLRELDKVLRSTDRYIDLVIMSHPQLDHFGGLIDILRRYRVGAFLTSGRVGTAKAFSDLVNVLNTRGVRSVILGAGDKIHYRKSLINILWPKPEFLTSKELNDSSIVAELISSNSKTLFTGDIGENIEKELLKTYRSTVDVLKVPHHGSKYSSSWDFLEVLKPKAAVIEVGKNSYGHPTTQTLERLERVGAKIYRTDKDGTVEILIDGKSARVFKGI